MPEDAVTIAYAAALQESKMHNLDYGDMGLGRGVPAAALEAGIHPAARGPGLRHHPVLPGLTAVHNYSSCRCTRRPRPSSAAPTNRVHAVPADGSKLAVIFTGRSAHGVSCWSASTTRKRTDLAAADLELTRTFGGVSCGRTAGRHRAPGGTARAAVAGRLGGRYLAGDPRCQLRHPGGAVPRLPVAGSNGFHGWSKDSGAPPPGVIS